MLAQEYRVQMHISSTLQPTTRRVAAMKRSASSLGIFPRQAHPAATLQFNTPQRGRSSSSSIRASAAQAAPGKLISKVEIPPFIPRSDIMQQLYRWSLIEVQEAGLANLGCPAKVTLYVRDGISWGFIVSFLKDGVSATDVRVAFDEEVVVKHEWIGRGADGFPVLEGNSEEVLGKNFEIRKVDERPVSEPVRAAIREFCTMLVGAINKYYAFGSCFVDDTT